MDTTQIGDLAMRLIPLTKGQSAIVDDQDYENLSQFKWFALWGPHPRSFYAARGVPGLTNGKRRQELMHRRILGLKHGDKRQCDHIYHKTLDNRRDRIRIVTRSQNQQNKRNTKGYYFNKKARKYQAQISINSVIKLLGYFDDPAEARAAYLAAKRQYHPSAPQGMFL